MSDFFGREIRERVGVVFVAAEGAGTLDLRIEAAKRAARISGRLPIAIIDPVENLASESAIPSLLEQLRFIAEEFRSRFDVRLGMIVIDTVAAGFVMADENSNAEAAGIVRTLARLQQGTGALLLPVHHHGKTLTAGMRGASAFQAGADVIISVTADRNDHTGQVSNRSLMLSKSRTGNEGLISGFDVVNIMLGFDRDDGKPFGAGYVQPSDVPPKSDKVKRDKQTILAFRAAFDAAATRMDTSEIRGIELDASERVLYSTLREEYLRFYTLPAGGERKSQAAAQKAFARCVEELPADFMEFDDPQGRRWIVRKA